MLLLVFSVSPFKKDRNKNQNRSIDWVQNLGKEESKYAKPLAKIQVTAILLKQDFFTIILFVVTQGKQYLQNLQYKYEQYTIWAT